MPEGPLRSAPAPDGSDPVTSAEDLDSVRRLFSEMAVPFMSQVRDFMLELRHADASTSWIDLCEPALHSLRATCDQLDTPELATALDEYMTLLASVRESPSGRVDGRVREDLLSCYDRMTELLPEAFKVSEGREPVIVQLLLLQVPGVHKRTIHKLYAAGVNHLEAFLDGKPDEIASVAGIELELARRIVAKFRDYRRRVSSMVAESIPDEENGVLASLVERLRALDEDYQRARTGWSEQDVAAKRRLRRERGHSLKEIYVVLARMGEVERIEALQRLPVRRQLEQLELFVQSPGWGQSSR
jgi:hypothetical protein